jgi:dTDP-glucose pyrophosphorylase
MNKNRDYYRAVLFGAVVAAFFLSMFYVFTREDKPQEPQSNFEVVDTYSYENRTCSVIRYTNPSTTWVYLLDCKEVKK